MPYKPSFGSIEAADEPIEVPESESPFRICVLGDFGGRQNRGIADATEEIATRRLFGVSRDTLDDVMAKLDVQLDLPVGDDDNTVNLSFTSLDDFHPDQLHDKIDQIADASDEDEKSALMNSVLHHPDFQALESVWRGLDWLLGRAARGGNVEVVLLDISLAELATDVAAAEDLSASGLYRLLIEKGLRGPKGQPWAVLVGSYGFDFTGQHAELLGRLSKIAARANAPFLSTVNPQVLKKDFALPAEAAPAWQALRELPEAALLGLAVPRFLLRLPYGENTKSIDKFSYEEMSMTPDASHYLWANPALGCAALLAQAFQKQGWVKPGAVLDLENLPIHVYTVDDEQEVTLAEAWLVRPHTEKLVKQGIMPFLCVRDKGAMQLLRFIALAMPPKDQPASELQGHWSGTRIAPPPPRVVPVGPKVGLVAGAQEKPRQGLMSPEPESLLPPVPAKMASSPAAVVSAPKPVAPAPVRVAAPIPNPTPTPVAPPPAAQAPPPPPPPKEPEPESEPAAEEEMDPDLAALLKELEGG
jgi:type VI secretion system protein ImpC